jgi:hypothetical protein
LAAFWQPDGEVLSALCSGSWRGEILAVATTWYLDQSRTNNSGTRAHTSTSFHDNMAAVVDCDFLSPGRGLNWLSGLLHWAMTVWANQVIKETCLISIWPAVFSHGPRIRTVFM